MKQAEQEFREEQDSPLGELLTSKLDKNQFLARRVALLIHIADSLIRGPPFTAEITVKHAKSGWCIALWSAMFHCYVQFPPVSSSQVNATSPKSHVRNAGHTSSNMETHQTSRFGQDTTYILKRTLKCAPQKGHAQGKVHYQQLKPNLKLNNKFVTSVKWKEAIKKLIDAVPEIGELKGSEFQLWNSGHKSVLLFDGDFDLQGTGLFQSAPDKPEKDEDAMSMVEPDTVFGENEGVDPEIDAMMMDMVHGE